MVRRREKPCGFSLRRAFRLALVGALSIGCLKSGKKRMSFVRKQRAETLYRQKGRKGGVLTVLGRIEKECDSALAALAAGDGKALEVLYDRMGRAILSVAYAVTGNLHDAEDVLSDTLVDAAVGAKGYRCGTGACAWLLTAARHNALDVVRRRSVRLRREAAEEEGAAEEPGFAAVEALDLLRMLEPDERETVVLRVCARLSYRDIAAVLGVSVAAAQKRYQRAIAKLRQSL